jgi:hypothetical protein
MVITTRINKKKLVVILGLRKKLNNLIYSILKQKKSNPIPISVNNSTWQIRNTNSISSQLDDSTQFDPGINKMRG